MADTAKKKAPAKPRKTAAKTTGETAEAMPTAAAQADAGAAAPKPKKAAKSNGAAEAGTQGQKHVSHEEIARLAHHYFTQRGHQHGGHEEDWHRAEQELRKRAS